MAEIKGTTYHAVEKRTAIIDELDQLGIRLKGLENIMLISGTAEEEVDYSVLLLLVAVVVHQLEDRVDQVKSYVIDSFH